MSTADLKRYFNPTSIAIVGASENFSSIGGKPLRHLLAHGYDGDIFPVNPKYESIKGLTCYPAVKDIPSIIDVALIAVSQKLIFDVIKQCKEKNVKFIILFGAGFAETGKEGEILQSKIVEYCLENNIRLCGPNCIGSINVIDSIPMGFSNSFEREKFIPGNVSLISQSGALGYAIFSLAQEENIGFSYLANTGNQADLNTLDFLDFLVDDQQTKVLSAYMEAIPDGQKLKNIAKRAAENKKPFLILKSGNSDIGKQAAMSHTGSLAGSEEAFNAVAKQYGIAVASDNDDFIDTIKVFSRDKRLLGKNVAVISTSGATGIMMADNCEKLGLSMTKLSQKTTEKLRSILPSFASTENPVDITAQALNDSTSFKQCLKTIIEAEEVDALVITTTFAGDLVVKMMEDVIEVDKKSSKPILVSLTGPNHLVGAARTRLSEEGVPTYNSIRRTVESLKKLLEFNTFQLKLKKNKVIPSKISKKVELKSDINEYEVKQLLDLWNIPVPKGGVIKAKNDIYEHVKKLSFPLVAKIISKDILHKSDVGGVVLNIQNETEAIKAMDTIYEKVKAAKPDAKLDGILFEEMASSPFLEVIVGIKKDPQFGPMIMCGLGGVFVELLKDVSLRCAPISKEEAFNMIYELQTFPLFTKYRSGPEYDIDALANALVNISSFAKQYEQEIAEMDINPLVVRARGEGVIALDGLIIKEKTNVNAVLS